MIRYMYIYKYKDIIDNLEVPFGNKFEISFSDKELKIEENNNYILDLHEEYSCIEAVNGIIGKNSSGKTTVLRLIDKIFSGNHVDLLFLIVLEKDENIIYIHNFEHDIEIKTELENKPKEVRYKNLKDTDIPDIIYYSGIFDKTKAFNESKYITDISTNGLLKKFIDSENERVISDINLRIGSCLKLEDSTNKNEKLREVMDQNKSFIGQGNSNYADKIEIIDKFKTEEILNKIGYFSKIESISMPEYNPLFSFPKTLVISFYTDDIIRNKIQEDASNELLEEDKEKLKYIADMYEEIGECNRRYAKDEDQESRKIRIKNEFFALICYEALYYASVNSEEECTNIMQEYIEEYEEQVAVSEGKNDDIGKIFLEKAVVKVLDRIIKRKTTISIDRKVLPKGVVSIISQQLSVYQNTCTEMQDKIYEIKELISGYIDSPIGSIDQDYQMFVRNIEDLIAEEIGFIEKMQSENSVEETQKIKNLEDELDVSNEKENIKMIETKVKENSGVVINDIENIIVSGLSEKLNEIKSSFKIIIDAYGDIISLYEDFELDNLVMAIEEMEDIIKQQANSINEFKEEYDEQNYILKKEEIICDFEETNQEIINYISSIKGLILNIEELVEYTIFEEEQLKLVTRWSVPVVKEFAESIVKLYPITFKVEFDHEDISSGHGAYLDLYSRLNSIIDKKNLRTLEKNIVLLIDEGDIYLHPEIQTTFLNNLMMFLNVFLREKRIQIIITSNSPFIISDIPHTNLIYLEEDDNGLIQQVNNRYSNLRTFGANIQNLLICNLFMKDGTIGEFAMNKINYIIKKLKEDDIVALNANERQRIFNMIDIIGEPIIREQLIRQYNSRYSDPISEKIKYYENEIRRLKGEQYV